ncbi:MAG TPA: hypothetical protein PLJ00_03310 [Chitinophagales bacterium]|nr:hypothetical protein [Chitinophagales bacterium]HRG26895.1 hypothetical protein [Chitinophagales bacterium]HRG85215.1 hypothetical protein [Chitinophagales bacterium]HRH51811.1 hypothetical protein [Chitinophagales bacterium]
MKRLNKNAAHKKASQSIEKLNSIPDSSIISITQDILKSSRLSDTHQFVLKFQSFEYPVELEEGNVQCSVNDTENPN